MSYSKYVVYDCDIGTDDAWGLLMLIKGEQLNSKMKTTTAADNGTVSSEADGYKILGVTCVHGNTSVDNCAKNALRVLDTVDRLDLPVYRGCANPMLPRTWQRTRYFHGQDGFGDLEHERQVDEKLIQQQHAVNAMYEFACKYPKMVDYILVGPLTNFAVCINMYGNAFLDKIRNVYVMGGNHKGKGNITKSAEFNFMMDPEAAHIVLENVKNSPITILPWETCIDGDFGIMNADWRFNVLGAANNRAVALMNYVEKNLLAPKGFVKWIVCDAMLVAAYIFPQSAIASKRLYHATVELTGTHTRGQMVLDHLRRNTNNADVIMEMAKDNYCKIISWTAGLDGINIEDLLL